MADRARSWCFTLNNYTEEERAALLECTTAKYIIIGREVGENGTPHLQGYIQFKNPTRLGGCKALNGRAHWEPARGSPEQNIDYCSKERNFEEVGIRPKIGKRTMLERIEINKLMRAKTLNELVDEGIIHYRDVRAVKNARYDLAQEGRPMRAEGCRGVWIWGPAGTGKTHKAKHEYPDAFIKLQNKWWDGYVGQEYVVMEDFDNPVLGHYIKIWADKWECTGEVKGAVVNLQHKKFIITSNYHPRDLWPDHENARNQELRRAIERRFEFIHMVFRQDGEQQQAAEQEEEEDLHREARPGDSYAPR